MSVAAKSGSICVKDVQASKLIKEFSSILKKEGKISVPAYVDVVKSGCGRQTSPTNKDWFYIRCAAIARALYLRPAGVGQLCKRYGIKENRGSKPFARSLASGSVIRKCLQELEKIQILEKIPNSTARQMSKIGRKTLDKIAGKIAGPQEQ